MMIDQCCKCGIKQPIKHLNQVGINYMCSICYVKTKMNREFKK